MAAGNESVEIPKRCIPVSIINQQNWSGLMSSAPDKRSICTWLWKTGDKLFSAAN